MRNRDNRNVSASPIRRRKKPTNVASDYKHVHLPPLHLPPLRLPPHHLLPLTIPRVRPPELRFRASHVTTERLTDLVKATQRSRSEILREMLEKYLEEQPGHETAARPSLRNEEPASVGAYSKIINLMENILRRVGL
jgi:hypothetical protein